MSSLTPSIARPTEWARQPNPVSIRWLPLLLLAAVLQAGTPAPAGQRQRAPAADAGWRATVRGFAAEHFKHPAWGFSHAVRDYLLARDLAAADHATIDDDVLYAAAYLHDIAAFPPWADAKVDHGDEGARIVDKVLQGTGFPMAKIEAVRAAIRTHMYERDPDGAEALYLHDADALDWLGAIGALRIIALIDPGGAKPAGSDIIPMLETNLAKVPPRVLSAAGRARVAARKRELEHFLRDLRRESDDFRNL